MIKFILVTCLIGCLAVDAFSGEGFPAYSLTRLQIDIPVAKFAPVLDPGEAVKDGKIHYEFTGQSFIAGGGDLNPGERGGGTSRQTPWMTLTELVWACQSGVVANITELFRPEDRAEVASFYQDPTNGARMLAHVKSITKAAVVIAIQKPDALVVILRLETKDGTDFLPLRVKLMDGKYVLAAGDLSGSLEANLITFLETNGKLSDISVQ